MATNDSGLEHQILAYLNRHPDAQDTLDGIVEWLLVESPTAQVLSRAGQALDNLVAQGLILERKATEACWYGLNRAKLEEVAAFLKAKD